MNMEKTDEKDKATQEIKNSLKDIENFAEGNYKEIMNKKDINLEELKEMTAKTGVSKITATDLLKASKKIEEK